MQSDIIHLVADGEYLYATDSQNRLWWCKRVVNTLGHVYHSQWELAHTE